MSVLRNLERSLSNVVEGTFGRLFRAEVRPVEIARKLVREMDDHKTVSLSRTYVPNEYVVYLSEADRARYDGMEREVADELCAYLLEHARSEKLSLLARPVVEFRVDGALGLGEFGIQTRLVRPAPNDGVEAPVRSVAPNPAPAAIQADHGQTMVYSTAARVAEPVASVRGATRVVLVIGESRYGVTAAGVVIGRSRDCDVIIDDANISRRHAELRGASGGRGWVIADLDSTNGVRVNGVTISAPTPVSVGDQLTLGTVGARLEQG